MKKFNIVLSILALTAVAGIITYAMSQGVAVLDPQGTISQHQRDMFWLAVGLGLSALIPVFVMTVIIVARYHTKAEKPAGTSDRSRWEVKPHASWMWASFVAIIITILAVFMYKSTFSIDPYLPLGGEEETLTVRVIALPWKWLFIYPKEDIATINELVIPVNTPISFELTADAPMSSFWIPKLGGMIYTMEGMVTKLHLEATSPGEFEGANTEINGEGYSHMRFKTKAVTGAEYSQWVEETRTAAQVLDMTTYEHLAEPSTMDPVQYFAATDPSLFGRILAKFMTPSHSKDVLGETHHMY